MLCENCHADNLKNALYCKSCGTEMAKGQKPADASNQDITAVKALLDLKSRQLKDLGDEVAELKNSVAGLADRFGFAEKELGTLTGTLETTAKESEGRALKAAEMKVASIRERMQKLEKSVDSVGPRSREIMSRLFLQFEKEFKNETEALRKENGQKLAAAVGAAQNRIEQAAGKLEQAAQKSV
ncbi:MAG: zinc ribbon domain-containing protein, partial [Candidatus Aenigmarchaeota archaeon]|nr:zinc ribbon domain-containing protein [Candidatus Aenigmarchaeota archaeon]